MTENFSEDILFRVVAQVCQMVGFESVLSSALYVLTDILRQLILSLGKRARSYSELCGRTNVELSDLFRAFSDLSIYPSELVAFFRNIGPLTLSISVPSYPVTFNRSDKHLAAFYGSDKHFADDCNTMECVDFESEELIGCLATGRKFCPQSQGFDYFKYDLGLNKTSEFSQDSIQESNVLDLVNHNSVEERESLKVTISLSDVKKVYKIKKDSKKQKNKSKKKKKKKNKKRNKHFEGLKCE